MSWWIVHAGVKEYKIKELLENPYDINNIKQIDEDSIRKIKEISLEKQVKLWGVKEGTNNKKNWGSFQRGDKVIFYTQGKYMYLGTVYFKIHDYELAKELWQPENEQVEILEYIFFLVDVQKINITDELFNKLIGYNRTPKGFNPIKWERIEKLIIEFGSVEKALESLMEGRLRGLYRNK